MSSLLEAFYILFENRGAKEVAATTEDIRENAAKAAQALDKVGDAEKHLSGAGAAAKGMNTSLAGSAAVTREIIAGARKIAAAEANLRGYLLGNQALREDTLHALGGQEGLQRRIAAETAQLAREMVKVNAETDSAADNAARLNREIRKADQNADGLARSFRGILGTVAGVMAGLSVGRMTVDAAETWQRYGNALRVAGLEGEQLTQVQDSLYRSAVKNGVELEGLGQLYGRVASASTELGVSQQQLLTVTNAVAAAIRVSGGDPNSASGAMLQLAQALGSGTVRAEEFNSMVEGMLPLVQAAAGASAKYGGSVAKLRTDVLAGTLSSKAFFDLIVKGSASLEGRASKAPLTLAQGLQNLSTAFTRVIGKANEALGITQKIGTAFGWAAEHIDIALIGVGAALTAAAVIAATVYGPAMWAAAAATTAALWPILLIVAAAAAIGAAFALAYEDVQAFFKGQPSLIGTLMTRYKLFGDLVRGTAHAFMVIGRAAVAAFKVVQDVVATWGPRVLRVVGAVIGGIVSFFRGWYSAAAPILGLLYDAMAAVFRKIWPVAKWLFQGMAIIAKAHVDLIVGAFRILASVLSVIFDWIGKAWDATFGRIITGLNRGVAIARNLTGLAPNQNNLAAAGLIEANRTLGFAGQSPLNAQTSNSISTRQSNSRSISIGQVNAPVDARGLNPQDVSAAFSTTLASRLQTATTSLDDGVSH